MTEAVRGGWGIGVMPTPMTKFVSHVVQSSARTEVPRHRCLRVRPCHCDGFMRAVDKLTRPVWTSGLRGQ
jgi:hypothetical protein